MTGTLEKEIKMGFSPNGLTATPIPTSVTNGYLHSIPDLSLRARLANTFVPEVFYIANPVADNILQAPTTREILSYAIRRGRLPTKGKTVLIGSGASAKGYWILGFVTELWKYIEINEYITSSISSMLAVGEEKGSSVLEDLALRIPELLPERDISTKLKLAQALTFGLYSDKIRDLGRFMQLMEADDIQGEDGKLIRSPRGVVTTSQLEDELKHLLGDKKVGDTKFKIMVTDYNKEGPVALGQAYPEMPLYQAIMAAIALQKVVPYQKYNGGLFGDAGPVAYFPLFKELIDRDVRTVIAVDMNFRNGEYKGLPGLLADEAQQGYVRNKNQTRKLMKDFTPIPPEVLLEKDDYSEQRVAFVAPKIKGVLPGAINIPIEDRLKLIDDGKKAAKAFINKFRQPMWQMPQSFQYAT